MKEDLNVSNELQDITNLILDHSSDPIFAFDQTGKYLYVNYAFAGPCQLTPDQIIGKRI